MYSFRERLRRLLANCYGVDDLGRAIMIAAVVLLVVMTILRSSILSLVTTALLIWAFVRIFSKNYAKRQQENRKWLEVKGRFTRFAPRFRSSAPEKKDSTYAYFRCPNCRQMVRVPKGKGKIAISCPRCHNQFIRKT